MTDNAKQIKETGESYGKRFADEEVSKTQLRRFYFRIKKAEQEYEAGNEDKAGEQLRLLEPLLARAAGRHEEMEVVKKNIESEIEDTLDGDRDLGRFFQLMEATVAYHYYYDNREDDE